MAVRGEIVIVGVAFRIRTRVEEAKMPWVGTTSIDGWSGTAAPAADIVNVPTSPAMVTTGRPMVPVIPGQRVDPAGGYRRSYEAEMAKTALEAIVADRERRGVGPEPVRPKTGVAGIKQGAETVLSGISGAAEKVADFVKTSPSQVVDFVKEGYKDGVISPADVAGAAKKGSEGFQEFAKDPFGVGALLDKATGKDEVVTSPAAVGVPDAWYPESGMSWAGEPGGKYLSARYPREFATWGQAVTGEGWKHVAQRGGWDAHTHPAHTSVLKTYKQSRAVQAYRSY